jgi:hypothetical protein
MEKVLYCTGRYGVVDAFRRQIWVNIYHEELAHAIRKTFWAKVPTTVFDLSQFQNYSDSTVDSTVSLDWKIPLAPYSSFMITPTLHHDGFESTQTTYHSDLLVNEPSHSRIPRERQLDLQQQMILYFNIMVQALPHQQSIVHPDHHDKFHMILDQFNQIFRTELTSQVIREKLYDLANRSDKNTYELPWIILKELDCLYG